MEMTNFEAYAALEEIPSADVRQLEGDGLGRWPTLIILAIVSLFSLLFIPVEYSTFSYALCGFALAMVLFIVADSGLFGHFNTMEALRRNEHGEIGFFILGLFVLIAAVLSRS